MQKFTKEQAIIIAGYTGITAGPFSDFHEDAEKRLKRPVWTHEFASKEMTMQLADLYREDFLAMCYSGT
jgi:hypothetical protein